MDFPSRALSRGGSAASRCAAPTGSSPNRRAAEKGFSANRFAAEKGSPAGSLDAEIGSSASWKRPSTDAPAGAHRPGRGRPSGRRDWRPQHGPCGASGRSLARLSPGAVPLNFRLGQMARPRKSLPRKSGPPRVCRTKPRQLKARRNFPSGRAACWCRWSSGCSRTAGCPSSSRGSARRVSFVSPSKPNCCTGGRGERS